MKRWLNKLIAHECSHIVRILSHFPLEQSNVPSLSDKYWTILPLWFYNCHVYCFLFKSPFGLVSALQCFVRLDTNTFIFLSWPNRIIAKLWAYLAYYVFTVCPSSCFYLLRRNLESILQVYSNLYFYFGSSLLIWFWLLK